jgi:hypothetical protein
MTRQSESAFAYVRRLSDSGFWGYLTLKFENGTVVHMRLEENLKPSDVGILPERNRGTYESENNKCGKH